MDPADFCQVVRLRLRPDATEAELLEARPHFVDAFSRLFPDLIEASLLRLEDGLYLDTWRWRSSGSALDALDQRERVDGYAEWDALVEIVAFEQGVVVSGGAGRSAP